MATIQEALLIAFDLHQDRRLDEADAIYRQILDALPGHVMALHLRGILLGQSGRLEEGCALIRQAIAGDGAQPDFHTNLAGLLEALGRLDEALDSMVQAATLDPTRLVQLNDFAMRSLKAGRPGEAAKALRVATGLQPLSIELRCNLAVALAANRQGAAAAAERRIALLLAPDAAEMLRLLGEYLLPLGRQAPDGEAVRTLRRALILDPLHHGIWNGLGRLHKEAGRLTEARRAYESGLAVDPAAAELWNNRSNVLKGQGDLETALAGQRRAAALQPDEIGIRSNLGDALLLAGHPEEALANTQAVLALAPDLGESRLLRALALLTLGRFEEGWAAWEDRWTVQPWLFAAGRFPQPAWMGRPLGGNRLLIWGEQGIGDEIQFASLLPLLVRAGVSCVLECEPRLVPLFARSLPEVEVVARGWPPDPDLTRTEAAAPDRPPIAAQIPAGSLPRLLADAKGVPLSAAPYLLADPARVSGFRAAIPVGTLAVGIAWHTTNPKHGRSRNIPLRVLAHALHRPGVRIVVLQYGDWTQEIAALTAEGIDIGGLPGLDPWSDLDGLAAAVAAVDLVVCIDNVTVHLAGALGRPTCALLPYAAEWRWLRDRTDTPWYPTVTLCRQQAPKDWSVPLRLARQRLDELAGG
ncbi:tetratricopeptide repeat protein [Azospirillum melinis]|uniref:Tetratricopeptide repeat protein n=1 Tax=Azospirillum melinis TaxID=328839 RepID=A0ABX2KE91_9PROT|nr:tetratricopeptide repeat protein [Azospirillum melinis]MBP2304680.1 Flp pilus assembly protein TadD [Azospirillum melinis]NUA98929.1 tetratricopeptide repeat protein [Azospirillum melinis]